MISETDLAAEVVAAYRATRMKPMFTAWYSDSIGSPWVCGGCALTVLACHQGGGYDGRGDHQTQHARFRLGVDDNWIAGFIGGYEGRFKSDVPGASHGRACREAVMLEWPEIRPCEITSGAACVSLSSASALPVGLPGELASTQKAGTP